MILCSQGGVCMNLVQEYLSLATEVVSFEAYENKKAVNSYNRQATRMRKIAIEITILAVRVHVLPQKCD